MPNPVLFYANAAQVNISLFDIQLTLIRQKLPDSEEQKKMQPGDTLEKLEELIVHMSPQHAKALLIALHSSVQAYEKNIGPINLPQEQQQAFAAIKISGPLH